MEDQSEGQGSQSGDGASETDNQPTEESAKEQVEPVAEQTQAMEELDTDVQEAKEEAAPSLPDTDVKVDPVAIEKLSLSVLEMFLPDLQKAKGQLNEVLHNQEVLIETVQQENSKFTDSTAMKKLTEAMNQTRAYQTKLLNLKKEMSSLTEKSAKLKRRAVKLQQQKQKEEITRAHLKEREAEKERMLTAKVAKKT